MEPSAQAQISQNCPSASATYLLIDVVVILSNNNWKPLKKNAFYDVVYNLVHIKGLRSQALVFYLSQKGSKLFSFNRALQKKVIGRFHTFFEYYTKPSVSANQGIMSLRP